MTTEYVRQRHDISSAGNNRTQVMPRSRSFLKRISQYKEQDGIGNLVLSTGKSSLKDEIVQDKLEKQRHSEMVGLNKQASKSQGVFKEAVRDKSADKFSRHSSTNSKNHNFIASFFNVSMIGNKKESMKKYALEDFDDEASTGIGGPKKGSVPLNKIVPI